MSANMPSICALTESQFASPAFSSLSILADIEPSLDDVLLNFFDRTFSPSFFSFA
jgi:hypothetical protein